LGGENGDSKKEHLYEGQDKKKKSFQGWKKKTMWWIGIKHMKKVPRRQIRELNGEKKKSSGRGR